VFRFLAASVTPPEATLTGSEAAHLTRVLRLEPGREILVFDGRGRQWRARVASAARDQVRVHLHDPEPAAPEACVRITLGVALLKGDQMDAIVRDATTLGIASIVPFVSAHAVVPASARREAAVERWTRIAIASAKQCGRAVVPDIQPVARFNHVVAREAFDMRVICAEPAWSGTMAVTSVPRPTNVLVCVGPEGGWSEDEIGLARSLGAHLVTLGPWRLRSETAPVVALAALWTSWGFGNGPR
jgi:16S rRNA (uracil1498-N3)-methyltransferase